jgi:hypothetical protein
VAQLGILPHVILACLNHLTGSRSAISRIYNRASYQEEMREALERWAEHVEAITQDS